nr:uncharacterized protein LOC128694073 [Cherax quadricarinatus]
MNVLSVASEGTGTNGPANGGKRILVVGDLRWQLMEEPISLENFNSMPRLQPEFFSCGLSLCKPTHSPVVFNNQTEVTLYSTIRVRYRFKFFMAKETEESCMNQWVFCTMKDNRNIGSFSVVPPTNADFILKVYAGVEDILDDDGATLNHVASFFLICEKARRNPVPWPLNNMAWGPTPFFYECGLEPMNQTGPVIVTWGGRKIIYFEKIFDIMIVLQVFDAEGNILDLKGIQGSATMLTSSEAS